ncbi:PsbB mRNA maturation factor Mbb1, chloroplastic, partial [Haematococcus lacustris]
VSNSDEEGSNQDVPLPAPVGGPKTLKINIDLLLLSLSSEQRRELQREAEAGLRRCLALDPGDGRTYVVLGKLLLQQRRLEEARTLYSHGVNMTGA